jgi:hypothetical protein
MKRQKAKKMANSILGRRKGAPRRDDGSRSGCLAGVLSLLGVYDGRMEEGCGRCGGVVAAVLSWW